MLRYSVGKPAATTRGSRQEHGSPPPHRVAPSNKQKQKLVVVKPTPPPFTPASLSADRLVMTMQSMTGHEGLDSCSTLHSSAYPDRQFGLGKSHASWFLLTVDFPGLPACPLQCINFIAPHWHLTPPSLSSAHPTFVYNGAPRGFALLDILGLRDDQEQAAIKLTGEDIGSKPLLEVLLDVEGILHCCSCCGKWESSQGDRFLECEACSEVYYCSETVSSPLSYLASGTIDLDALTRIQCREADSSENAHQADCVLLQQGRALEVEHHRKRHDNTWNLKNRKSA